MTINLKAIRARCAAATTGPWVRGVDWVTTEIPTNGTYATYICATTDENKGDCGTTKREIYDAAFIAAARQDIPALLDLVDALALDGGLDALARVAELEKELAARVDPRPYAKAQIDVMMAAAARPVAAPGEVDPPRKGLIDVRVAARDHRVAVPVAGASALLHAYRMLARFVGPDGQVTDAQLDVDTLEWADACAAAALRELERAK